MLNSTRSRLLRSSWLYALALLLCVLAAAAWHGASASESETTPERITTVLEPGSNLIGWISDGDSTRGLFRSIPQLQAVWTYDSRARVWRRAVRPGAAAQDVGAIPIPPGHGLTDPSADTETIDLTWLRAGAGLILQVSGNRPLSKWRHATPARGMVTLHTGANLSAWLGLDRTRLDEAVHSIGTSLQRVSIWSTEAQEFQTYRADELDQAEDLPYVNRGDAIWVTVDRLVNWLQPTGVMPQIKFPGGATAEVQEGVRASIRRAMQFFREVHRIEADFSKFTIYVPKDVDSLFEVISVDYPAEQFKFHDIANTYNTTAAFVTHSAVAMVLKQRTWTEDTAIGYGSDQVIWTGLSIAAHEYAHVLQWQLRDVNGSAREKPRGDEQYSMPFWLEEGNATWVEDALLVWGGGHSWSTLRQQAFDHIAELGKLEFWQYWKYKLGRAAFHVLAQRAGQESWLEFWRQAAPVEFGPQYQWSALTPWKRAFREAFDLTFEQFEQGFERARQTTGQAISGTVVLSDELRRTGEVMHDARGMRVVLEHRSSRVQDTATTDQSGGFILRAPYGAYRIKVDLGSGCSVSYPPEDGQAGLINVTDSDIEDLEIVLGANACPSPNRSGAVLGRVLPQLPAGQLTEVLVRVQASDELVGWVSKTQSVSHVFASIPRLQAIWAFDADLQQWRRAIRPGVAVREIGVPDSPWQASLTDAVRATTVAALTDLTPGIGVWLQLDGDDAVILRQSRTPARGSVTLKPGLNAVAWMGVDGTPLTDAIRGIGKSLDRIAIWSDANDSYVSYDPSQLDQARSAPVLNRGDAIWVTVSRNVHWLQPTAVLPSVKFPGGVTRTVRERVLSSLADVLRFYRETFAIEADFSQFIVYAPSDADALIEALDTDFASGFRNPGGFDGPSPRERRGWRTARMPWCCHR